MDCATKSELKHDLCCVQIRALERSRISKITGASTLANDEVDRMVKDAEQYADEDKKQREAVDVKNQVCQPVFDLS